MLDTAQFEKLKAQLGSSNTYSLGEVPQTAGEYFKGVASEVLSMPSKIFASVEERGTSIAKGIERTVKGEQSIPQLGVNVAGGTAGVFNDVVGQIFNVGIKAIPEIVKKPVMDKINQLAAAMVDNPTIYAGLNAVNKGIDAYLGWEKENPGEAQSVRDLVNIGLAYLTKPATRVVGEEVAGLKKALSVVDELPPDGGGTGLLSKVINAPKNIAGYATSRVPKLLGIFAGESDETIKAILADTKAADIGIQGGDEALRKIVTEGASESIKLKNSFLSGHAQAKEAVLGKYSKVLIPKSNLIGEFNKLLTDYKVKFAKDGTLDFSTSEIRANPGEIKKINDTLDALRKWDKMTPSEIDDFKQIVGKFTKFANEAGGTSKSPLLGKFYHKIDEIIKAKLPKDVSVKYAELNTKFTDSIDLFDEMVDLFNSGDPFTKLAGVLGKNKDALRQILEFYDKKAGKSTMATVAGREVAMEKSAAFGFLNPRSWIDFFISPKTQAKLITKFGDKK